MAVELVVHRLFGCALYRHLERGSLNAPGSPQHADQIKSEVEIFGCVGPTTPYFDPLAFTPSPKRDSERPLQQPVWTGRHAHRSERVPNVDLSRALRLQFRLEGFNITNRPLFANPRNLNVSNLQLNPDGTVRNLNGFGVINTTQNAGREFAERYMRVGIRMSF